MSNAEFSALSLHTKDWEHFPNANMQVSGPRCPPQATPSAAGWLSWCLLFVLRWLLPFCRVSQSFALLRSWVRQLLRAVRCWFAPCAMATKITWFPTALNQATKRQLISATESMALAAVCHSCTLTLQHSDNRCVSRAGTAPTTMRDGHHQIHVVSDSADLALRATTQCLSALPVSSHFRCVFVGYRLAFRPRSTRSVRQRA